MWFGPFVVSLNGVEKGVGVWVDGAREAGGVGVIG